MNTLKLNFKKFRFNKLGSLLITDNIMLFLAIFSLGKFSPDYAIMATFFLLIPYLIITNRKKLFYHFLVAIVVSFIWIFIANGKYGYSNDNIVLFGLNIFPIFGWSVALFGSYAIYSHFESKIKRKTFLKKIIIFSSLYWVGLIFVESVAYHFFNIQNITTGNYKGLPICNCLHAPVWMQITYFLMGPLYFIICSLLKLKNPHETKTIIFNPTSSTNYNQ